ncbi:DUF5134 domain-containing protein [Streptomyces sp. NPDC059248]|uniref:DUF5134 domain-containing protein n=1 Tax=Streptomyces sp. NPDC059248 TaxID=3346791 RepID=UPI00368F646E
MHGPAVPGWLLVVLCGATGAYCLARTRGCAGGARRILTGEALMGFGMAAMALPVAAAAPPRRLWAAGAVVFGGSALLALADTARRRGGHGPHHVVGSLAMAFMAVSMARAPEAGHPAHADPAAVSLLTGALLAYYAVYVLRSGARLVPAGAPGPGPPGGAVPDLIPVCRLVMALGMLAMLPAG